MAASARKTKARERLDHWLDRLVASYIEDRSRADLTRTEASIELSNLAMFEPTRF